MHASTINKFLITRMFMCEASMAITNAVGGQIISYPHIRQKLFKCIILTCFIIFQSVENCTFHSSVLDSFAVTSLIVGFNK